MSKAMELLLDQARTNLFVLQQAIQCPDAVAASFGLNSEESMALKTDDFDALATSLGVDRSFRAAHHDDAYLS
jgi:hypothetical protein